MILLFEEAIGSAYNETIFVMPGHDVAQSKSYQALVTMRVKRHDGFINDRGFRHIKNREDYSGFTYAFWLIREKE